LRATCLVADREIHGFTALSPHPPRVWQASDFRSCRIKVAYNALSRSALRLKKKDYYGLC
ncbi:hypothetical protein, partial [Pseudomonas sp. H3(2019)]|uniref:hypothetical protein n=1 Tax=Pseudomonas sp. H3(2019) TaxID=2598724 RepID=UPI001C49B767